MSVSLSVQPGNHWGWEDETFWVWHLTQIDLLKRISRWSIRFTTNVNEWSFFHWMDWKKDLFVVIKWSGSLKYEGIIQAIILFWQTYMNVIRQMGIIIKAHIALAVMVPLFTCLIRWIFFLIPDSFPSITDRDCFVSTILHQRSLSSFEGSFILFRKNKILEEVHKTTVWIINVFIYTIKKAWSHTFDRVSLQEAEKLVNESKEQRLATNKDT